MLLIHSSKGVLDLLIGMALEVSELTRYVSAVLIVVGHNYSRFLGFRGGKGSAAVLGMSALML